MAAVGGGEGKGKGWCELCRAAAARVYCGADDATLCWECDAQVHGANFLVARHARALLCRRCERPTPWFAAGPRLGPTASICERCVGRGGGADGVAGDGEDEDEDEEEDEDEDEDYEEDEEGEGENQVVPWSEDSEATPPPVASSTSSSSRDAAGESAQDDLPFRPTLCQQALPARHCCRSDEATSSRNGGDLFFASRHRKRSSLTSGSAQSGFHDAALR